MDNLKNVSSCAIIIGSFKPYTAGHHFLITKASEENELVLLSISQKDRKRKGEHPVEWQKMKKIWENYIFEVLPKNVIVGFSDSPITSLYNFFKNIKEDKNRVKTIYNLYMDDKDKIRYCYQDHEIKEKYPNLFDVIKTKTFSREKNINVSATKMRKALQDNNLEQFKQCLPEELKIKSEEIFKLLL